MNNTYLVHSHNVFDINHPTPTGGIVAINHRLQRQPLQHFFLLRLIHNRPHDAPNIVPADQFLKLVSLGLEFGLRDELAEVDAA